MSERAEQEDFGEAELGEAQADDPPADPEMLEGTDAPPESSGEDAGEVPAVPEPRDPTADEQTEQAAEEAGRIGGDRPDEDVPPEQVPVTEGGGGEAEGFELAEEQLEENATHGEGAADPLGDRFPPEDASSSGHTIYGEPDQARKPDRPDQPGPEAPE
jgi:hypothetical protein